eukprot:6196322-Pleurochrysis_carterae.AAC.2
MLAHDLRRCMGRISQTSEQEQRKGVSLTLTLSLNGALSESWCARTSASSWWRRCSRGRRRGRAA